MKQQGIIDFIYSRKDCNHIRNLYKDKDLQSLIQQQIGKTLLDKRKVFVNGNSLDILAMICLNQNFTTDSKECLSVAVFICRGMKNSNPIPYFTETSGLNLASQILIALSFFKPGMIKRYHHGAPSPGWYRRISQVLFSSNGYNNLAYHHQNWENFLSEVLI